MDIRGQIAEICGGQVAANPYVKADKILNLPVSEEGVCTWCDGRRTYPSTAGLVTCPNCDGTGKLFKTLKQLIEEAQNG